MSEGSDERFDAYGIMMKWGPAIFFYAVMLLIIQTVIYISAPKYRGGCVRTAFPETATRFTYTQEYIYCFQNDSDFNLATIKDFEYSCIDIDSSNPIIIAEFQWIDRENTFKKFSLLSIGARWRQLHFSARTGSQGEYNEIQSSEFSQLQRRITTSTLQTKYLQPANSGLYIPIIDSPIILLKLLIQAGLIYCSAKLSVHFGHLFTLQSKINKRKANGLCIHCAYDCDGLPSLTCPECGQLHRICTLE